MIGLLQDLRRSSASRPPIRSRPPGSPCTASPSWGRGRSAKIVDFHLYLAAALVTIRQIIQRARTRYRWDTRPTTKRLK